MMPQTRAAVWLVLIAVLAGCASSSVRSYQSYQGNIPRPDRIIVYNIAPAPSQFAPEVAIAVKGPQRRS